MKISPYYYLFFIPLTPSGPANSTPHLQMRLQIMCTPQDKPKKYQGEHFDTFVPRAIRCPHDKGD